jgi:hypothetical protein
MKAADRVCLACGAPQDEHDGPSGPCQKTKCKAFSDSYTAFNENWQPELQKKTPEPDIPVVPYVSRQTWKDWIVAHPFYTAAAILTLFVIAAVVLWLTR